MPSAASLPRLSRRRSPSSEAGRSAPPPAPARLLSQARRCESLTLVQPDDRCCGSGAASRGDLEPDRPQDLPEPFGSRARQVASRLSTKALKLTRSAMGPVARPLAAWRCVRPARAVRGFRPDVLSEDPVTSFLSRSGQRWKTRNPWLATLVVVVLVFVV